MDIFGRKTKKPAKELTRAEFNRLQREGGKPPTPQAKPPRFPRLERIKGWLGGKLKRWLLFGGAAAVLLAIVLWISVNLIQDRYRALTAVMDHLLVGEYHHLQTGTCEIRTGINLDGMQFMERLRTLGYQMADSSDLKPGEFFIEGSSIYLYTRPVNGISGRKTLLRMNGPVVDSMIDHFTGAPLEKITLEPLVLTSFINSPWEIRTPLKFDEFPPELIKAVMTIEDREFFEHTGIDFTAEARAVIVNLKALGYKQGASTITQQVVKTLLYRKERTIKAKYFEKILSWKVERHYLKEELLELYLNNIYMGQIGPYEVRGMAAAAEILLGKPLNELSLEQYALLTALVRSPMGASPVNKPEKAAERTKSVLATMRKAGDPKAHPERIGKKITADLYRFRGNEMAYYLSEVDQELEKKKREKVLDLEVDEDLTEMLEDNTPDLEADKKQTEKESGNTTTNTVDKGQTEKKSDNTSNDKADKKRTEEKRDNVFALGLTKGGLNIELAMDPWMQSETSRILSEGLAGKSKEFQGAVVIMNPADGGILAAAGGRDYRKSTFNRAFDSRRQIGSLVKPFIYLTALGGIGVQPRLTQATLIDDAPLTVTFSGQKWNPENYDKSFAGTITIRQALAQSRNIPAVKVGMETGLKKISALLQQTGINERPPLLPSILLGAVTSSPVRVAAAYSALANGGSFVEPTLIRRISRNDRVILEAAAPHPIFVKQPCYVMTDILTSVLTEGTGRNAGKFGFNGVAAGKSGTTSDTKDAWFAGYNHDLVTVVWLGRDDNKPTGMTGSTGALPIWSRIMGSVAGGSTDEFPVPAGIAFADIDKGSGKLAGGRCGNKTRMAFLTGTEPDEYCGHAAGKATRKAVATSGKPLEDRSIAALYEELKQDASTWVDNQKKSVGKMFWNR